MVLNSERLAEAAVLSEWEQFSLDLIQPRRLVERVASVFEFEVVPLIVVFDLAGSMVCECRLFDWKMFDLRHLHCSQLNFVVATIAAAAVAKIDKSFVRLYTTEPNSTSSNSERFSY